jgi:hypothetical protein
MVTDGRIQLCQIGSAQPFGSDFEGQNFWKHVKERHLFTGIVFGKYSVLKGFNKTY